MTQTPYLSPRERVFKTLRNLQKLALESEDLNADRAAILKALERAVSWEDELKSADWPHADRASDETGASV